ncbi:MAG: hypothetical protein ABIG89_01920 [Candidatus Woesearchaeota archaeon]
MRTNVLENKPKCRDLYDLMELHDSLIKHISSIRRNLPGNLTKPELNELFSVYVEGKKSYHTLAMLGEEGIESLLNDTKWLLGFSTDVNRRSNGDIPHFNGVLPYRDIDDILHMDRNRLTIYDAMRTYDLAVGILTKMDMKVEFNPDSVMPATLMDYTGEQPTIIKSFQLMHVYGKEGLVDGIKEVEKKISESYMELMDRYKIDPEVRN